MAKKRSARKTRVSRLHKAKAKAGPKTVKDTPLTPPELAKRDLIAMKYPSYWLDDWTSDEDAPQTVEDTHPTPGDWTTVPKKKTFVPPKIRVETNGSDWTDAQMEELEGKPHSTSRLSSRPDFLTCEISPLPL